MYDFETIFLLMSPWLTFVPLNGKSSYLSFLISKCSWKWPNMEVLLIRNVKLVSLPRY